MSTGESAGTDRPADGPDLADAANVLVLSGGLDSDARTAYVEQMAPPGVDSLIVVSFTEDPVRWLDDWGRAGEAPERAMLVENAAREADRAGVERAEEAPGDLTGLGITVSERLTDWGEDGPSLLLFESLTVLLQYADLKRVFRFLHVVVNRVKATGSTAHYHLDPDAHDDQTIATLTSLFDAVVAYEDGTWQLSGYR
jgi:hypothetical protein